MAAFVRTETATLTFAIINIIFVSLSTAGSLGFLMYWYYVMVLSGKEHEMYEFLVSFLVVISWLAISLIGLVFGSFLVNGILKKKPEHLKAFYVYGVVKLCIIVFVMVTLICLNAFPSALHVNLIIFLILAGFGVNLRMVRQTYTKMQIQNDQFAHSPLKEKF